jgi:uncharacterized protein YrrD
MIRASELSGRAVVDIDAAEKLGRIDKIIIDPEARRVAAYLVTRGGAFTGGRAEMLLPATSVYAIGPDAVTVRQDGAPVDAAAFERLPRVSDVVGRKIVSRTGSLLGVVDDVLISGADGVIVGYELADANPLGAFLGGSKRARRMYLRADADLRAGRDLIVAPEDALAEWPEEQAERPLAQSVSPTEVSNAADPRSDSFRRDDSVRAVAPPPGVLP